MNKNLSIKDFSTHLFWDVDIDKFDLEKHKVQLTYKVVEFGQLSDWKNLLLLYGEEEVKNIVLN
ncbi:MAG: hypothetical protein M9887_04680, partial [Chitinophagales bacterium]|nr:hypothetical protein [Chitinophagales bacterium]